MAIASPSAPTSFLRPSNSTHIRRFFPNRVGSSTGYRILTRPISVSASSSSDGEVMHGELHNGNHHQQGRMWKGPFPVYVKLPVDSVGPTGQAVRRKKAMAQSFRALAAAGVEGVVMDVWWGIVERDLPRVYNWNAYLDIVLMANSFGLKVRAVMAFHQSGSAAHDPFWIPLPRWVLEEIDKDPDVTYADRFGRRNMEYISLGCDILPILHGRSPVQAYADFMRSFRDNFQSFLGGIITGIQVGLGPDSELRYPSCPTQKLTHSWRSRELGEFQCYDKYMLASLNACAYEIGMREWANGGPIGASNLMQNPENTDFFRTEGSWKTPYGEFFLGWYSGLLIQHGERICREADIIFRSNGVNLSAKVAGIHWHYNTESHPSELTSGYYNTSLTDGFLPIAKMFSRYNFSMCCACFEMKDSEEQQIYPASRPEGLLKQLLLAAKVCDVPLEGENSGTNLDDESFKQVLNMSKFYADGLDMPSFSFNFVRMDKNLFEYRNWVSFTRFVRHMSDVNVFRSNLGFGGSSMMLSHPSATACGGAV